MENITGFMKWTVVDIERSLNKNDIEALSVKSKVFQRTATSEGKNEIPDTKLLLLKIIDKMGDSKTDLGYLDELSKVYQRIKSVSNQESN